MALPEGRAIVPLAEDFPPSAHNGSNWENGALLAPDPGSLTPHESVRYPHGPYP
jgi:hypothetical protein